jgi:SAM-dependent methyltransferase
LLLLHPRPRAHQPPELNSPQKETLMQRITREDVLNADFLGRITEERRIFEETYEKSKWGTGSGNGSHPAATSDYRAFLERFIVMNRVMSIVDVGCGDWQSSRYISFNGARYTGFDVVKSLVDINRTKFGLGLVSFEGNCSGWLGRGRSSEANGA